MYPEKSKRLSLSGQNKGVIPIFPFFTGTVVFSVTGIKPETLINRLRFNVPMRKIRKTDENGLRFEVMYRDKNTVWDCVRSISSDACVTVEKERGFPVLARRCKKRYGLFAGGLAALLLVFISAQMIWQVSVEGNQTVESAQIEKLLKSLGIAEGMPKKTKDLEYLYNTFLLSEKRISWISVNYDGMIAHVEVKEAEKPEKQIDKTKITNLIASADGVIKRVDTLDGSAAVFPGDTVCKGNLLVSAFVETRETGTVLRTARGSVWASTVHIYEVSVPKKQAIKQYTGKKDTKHTLCILGKNIPLSFPSLHTDEPYDKDYQKEPFVLFGFIRLPFEVLTEESSIYRVGYKQNTKEKAAAEAAAEIAKRIDRDLIRAEILKREDAASETENAYVFTCELTCLENIALPVQLEFEEKTANLGVSAVQLTDGSGAGQK